jgi:hypothetical protein
MCRRVSSHVKRSVEVTSVLGLAKSPQDALRGSGQAGATCRTLAFFAEELDVGRAFFYWGALAALDLFADLLDDVGIS